MSLIAHCQARRRWCPCPGAAACPVTAPAELHDPRSLPSWTGAQNNVGMRAISSRRRARTAIGATYLRTLSFLGNALSMASMRSASELRASGAAQSRGRGRDLGWRGRSALCSPVASQLRHEPHPGRGHPRRSAPDGPFQHRDNHEIPASLRRRPSRPRRPGVPRRLSLATAPIRSGSRPRRCPSRFGQPRCRARPGRCPVPSKGYVTIG